jgi:hypothetical protein
LKDLPDDFDYSLVISANPEYFEYVPLERQTNDLSLLAVSKFGGNLQYVQHQTPQIVAAAVANNPLAAIYSQDYYMKDFPFIEN